MKDKLKNEQVNKNSTKSSASQNIMSSYQGVLLILPIINILIHIFNGKYRQLLLLESWITTIEYMAFYLLILLVLSVCKSFMKKHHFK